MKESIHAIFSPELSAMLREKASKERQLHILTYVRRALSRYEITAREIAIAKLCREIADLREQIAARIDYGDGNDD